MGTAGNKHKLQQGACALAAGQDKEDFFLKIIVIAELAVPAPRTYLQQSCSSADSNVARCTAYIINYHAILLLGHHGTSLQRAQKFLCPKLLLAAHLQVLCIPGACRERDVPV